jgi:hypothetical protein
MFWTIRNFPDVIIIVHLQMLFNRNVFCCVKYQKGLASFTIFMHNPTAEDFLIGAKCHQYMKKICELLLLTCIEASVDSNSRHRAIKTSSCVTTTLESWDTKKSARTS